MKSARCTARTATTDPARLVDARQWTGSGHGGLKGIEAGGYLPILVISAQSGHKLRALQAGAKELHQQAV